MTDLLFCFQIPRMFYTITSSSAILLSLLLHLAFSRLVPLLQGLTAARAWKLRNTATSLFHSLAAGVWSTSLYSSSISADLVSLTSPSCAALLAFSVGYFIHDTWDSASAQYRGVRPVTLESVVLLAHHAIVITCFSTALISDQFVCLGGLSLLVEVNSVFLHGRTLVLLLGWPRDSIVFRTTALINMITYCVFRLVLLSWLCLWMASRRQQVLVQGSRRIDRMG